MTFGGRGTFVLLLGVQTLLATLAAGASSTYTYSYISHVKRPNHTKYVACYFQSWAIYRNGDGIFQIQDIKPEYCTHLIYSFAGLNGTSFHIKSLDPWADLNDHNGKDGYRKLTQLRYQQPGLKVSLAVGGWNEGSFNYSEMARHPAHRRRFVNSVVDFLRVYNFQGLDLDWEFPTTRGGAEYDKYNYLLLLQDLKQAFRQHDFLLTAAISADTDTMDRRYDVRRMAEHLDYIHLMTYDYHTLGGGVVMPNAPLYEVNKTLNYLLETGVSPKKFVLGLPTYGRAYILADALRSQDENPIGKPALKSSWSGPYNSEEGFLGYNEVCKYLLAREWIDKWDNLSSTPYAIQQHKVIVYDNERSVQLKVHLAMEKGLAGVMVWSIDTDDFRGDCHALQHSQEHRQSGTGHGLYTTYYPTTSTTPRYSSMNRPRNRAEELLRERQYPIMQAIAQALERDSRGGATVSNVSGLLLVLVALVAARNV
ncbi:probable chitinase 2 [Trichogramma pretiosum]|uniref:probable chitinase 2 n=1 Tax=Trichogramma pretiosum TaxID=7493 RepID=UPI0006C95B7D|nr:probable chitinase 2 [Trichogramma pretiosum]